MATRFELQSKLEELLGNENVYYKPPESKKMEYPAIRYSKSKIESRNADNKKYSKLNRYELVVIDRKPDNEVIDKLLELPYCSHVQSYPSDNLQHDVFTLYF